MLYDLFRHSRLICIETTKSQEHKEKQISGMAWGEGFSLSNICCVLTVCLILLSATYMKVVNTQTPFTKSQESTIQLCGLIFFILDPWPPLLFTTSHLPLTSDSHTTLVEVILVSLFRCPFPNPIPFPWTTSFPGYSSQMSQLHLVWSKSVLSTLSWFKDILLR